MAGCTDPQKAGEKFIRLNSIAITLKDKRQCLKALDEAIFAKTDKGDVEKEIDESSDWETRLYECLEKIESFKRGDFIAFQTLSQVEQQSPGPSTVQATAVGLGANVVLLWAGDGALNISQIFDGSLSIGGGNSTRSNTNSANIGVRLPKINLPSLTGVMAQLVERLPHNRKVDGSSHGRVIPKTLKMVRPAFLFWRSKNEKGVGKLNTRSYQWTSPPL